MFESDVRYIKEKISKEITSDFLESVSRVFVLGLRLQSRYVLKLDTEFWGRNEMETTAAVLKPPPPLVIAASAQTDTSAFPRRSDSILPLTALSASRPDTTLVTSRGGICKQRTRE
jgi:hypothetical protein